MVIADFGVAVISPLKLLACRFLDWYDRGTVRVLLFSDEPDSLKPT